MGPNPRRKIFLDANVVIRAGKPPGGPLIARISDLVDAGYVNVVTTDLTKIEIAKKHAINDLEVLSGLTKRRVRDLSYEILGVIIPEISIQDLHSRLITKYKTSVDKMFNLLRAETLSIDNVKPSVVFDAYLHQTGLFGDDAKKHQFPDAFVFEALRTSATKEVPLTIVSDDKDFAAVVRQTDNIDLLKSIGDLFAAFGLTIEAAPDVEDFVQGHLEKIVDAVNNELNQFGLQVDDIEEAEIDEATVENVNFIDFRTFRTVGDGKDVLVVGRVVMDVHVSYHHPDWDTAVWDSEDRVAVPLHDVAGEKNIDVEANFNMTLKVDHLGKPTSIGQFAFDDDNFFWVSIAPNDFD